MTRVILFFCILLSILSCLNSKWTIKKYLISGTYYIEVRTSEYKGYSWIYLCQAGANYCNDIYKQRDSLYGTYFERIEEIKINNIINDTLTFSVVINHSGNKECFLDTLLLSTGKFLSANSNYLQCE